MNLKPKTVSFGRFQNTMHQVDKMIDTMIKDSIPLEGTGTDDFTFSGPISKSIKRTGFLVVGSHAWGDETKVVGG